MPNSFQISGLKAVQISNIRSVASSKVQRERQGDDTLAQRRTPKHIHLPDPSHCDF